MSKKKTKKKYCLYLNIKTVIFIDLKVKIVLYIIN